MNEITIEVESNEDIWQVLDKGLEIVFIHKFRPNNYTEWWKTNLETKNGSKFNNMNVRQMQMDIQTDLIGLKNLLELNIHQLRIYQFDKNIPDSLIIENLPEQSRFEILKQNGLRHFFFLDFEFLTINSFDLDFINAIHKNPKFADKIIKH
jgi:hypothetical protein